MDEISKAGVKLHFDATTGAIDWKAAYPKPKDLAEFLWSGEPEEATFEIACEFADTDPEAFDMVVRFLKQGQPVADAVKLRLFDVLVAGRPRKGKAATQYRDARLRVIADLLVQVYGMPRANNEANEAGMSAASILNGLSGTPAKRTIANIICT